MRRGSFPRVRRNVALRPCKGRHGVLDGLALLGLAHVLADVQPRLLCQRVDGGGVAQNVDGGVVGHAALLGHFLGGPQQQVAAAVLRVDGLHIGLVQPPDFCVGEGLPGVELLLELLGQLITPGGGVAGKSLLDGGEYNIIAHLLEGCTNIFRRFSSGVLGVLPRGLLIDVVCASRHVQRAK